VESNTTPGKATFVYYGKPFKSLFKLARIDGTQITAGFDGKVFPLPGRDVQLQPHAPRDLFASWRGGGVAQAVGKGSAGPERRRSERAFRST